MRVQIYAGSGIKRRCCWKSCSEYTRYVCVVRTTVEQHFNW